jgi:hypothetical protein
LWLLFWLMVFYIVPRLLPRRDLDGGAHHGRHPPDDPEGGVDLVWFGIFIVLVVEMAQITPPVGFNLFVLRDDQARHRLDREGELPALPPDGRAVGLIYFFPRSSLAAGTDVEFKRPVPAAWTTAAR